VRGERAQAAAGGRRRRPPGGSAPEAPSIHDAPASSARIVSRSSTARAGGMSSSVSAAGGTRMKERMREALSSSRYDISRERASMAMQDTTAAASCG